MAEKALSSEDIKEGTCDNGGVGDTSPEYEVTILKDPDEAQLGRIRALFNACVQYEGLTLSFPDLTDESVYISCIYDVPDRGPASDPAAPVTDSSVFTGTKPQGSAGSQAVSSGTPEFLSVLIAFIEDDYIEMTAFTHPLHRCEGLFSCLFRHFLETEADERPISFYPDANSYDALMTLDMLEAEYTVTEHVMICELAKHCTCPADTSVSMNVCDDRKLLTAIHSKAFGLSKKESGTFINTALDDDAAAWIFKKEEKTVGMCFGSADNDTVYLFSFCILPEYQGKKIGSQCLSMLINVLAGAYRYAKVQVTEENEAAFALYKNAGFESKEELMEYWY